MSADTVRRYAKLIAERHPGRFIELRIPPYIAVQIGVGAERGAHRRGKPPVVIEFSATDFLAYCDGEKSWTPPSSAPAELAEIFPITK